jgi:hypothetical protein
MDDDAVRERAQAMCDALVAGDIDRATTDFSPELRKHLGEVLGLLPLPSTEGTVQSVERGGSSHVVLLRLVGESEEVIVQTRWKDRDGKPTMIEASHESRKEVAPPAGEAEGEAQAEGQAQDLAG